MMKQNICVVHRGALGDFLCIWPALHALSQPPDARQLFWAGNTSHLPWVRPLGIEPAPPAMRRWALAHSGATRPVTWTGEGEQPHILWFGLEFSPFTKEWTPDHASFIPTISQELPGQAPHTRDMALEALGAREHDWSASWCQLFGCHEPQDTDSRVLLFPGSGHTAKEWPLSSFLDIAARIRTTGHAPVLVLGPVEQEKGLEREIMALCASRSMDCPALERPGSLSDLSLLLLACHAVLGNDSGPMHLAGMHRVPGVVLFGPTSRRQWGPPGLTAVAAPVPCRPCTATTADIPCACPACMAAITPEQAWHALRIHLDGKKSLSLPDAPW